MRFIREIKKQDGLEQRVSADPAVQERGDNVIGSDSEIPDLNDCIKRSGFLKTWACS